MEAPKIHITRDYDRFKVMGGNRNVDGIHVDKLKASMLENPKWFATKPIVVNEEDYVIDGQHRLQAAKQLGIDLYYVVGEKMNLAAARAMNIRQKQWTLQDYAESYASGGNKNYELLLELSRKNAALPLGVVISITEARGNAGYDIMSDFRQGRFQIEPVAEALADTEFYAAIVKLSGRRIGTPFVRVMNSIMRDQDFSKDRFLNSLKVGADLVVSGLARDNYRAIEDVYNYHKSETNRVRFY